MMAGWKFVRTVNHNRDFHFEFSCGESLVCLPIRVNKGSPSPPWLRARDKPEVNVNCHKLALAVKTRCDNNRSGLGAKVLPCLPQVKIAPLADFRPPGSGQASWSALRLDNG